MENLITPHIYDRKAYRSNILTTGALLGVLLALPSYCGWLANFYDQSLGGYATFIQFAFYFVALVVMGKRACGIYTGGEDGIRFSYGKAYLHGILSSLMAGLVSGILSWILIGLLSPEYYASTVDFALAKVVETTPNITDEMLDAARTMTISMSKPYILIPTTILGSAFTGALVSLISALIVKKDVKKS